MDWDRLAEALPTVTETLTTMMIDEALPNAKALEEQSLMPAVTLQFSPDDDQDGPFRVTLSIERGSADDLVDRESAMLDAFGIAVKAAFYEGFAKAGRDDPSVDALWDNSDSKAAFETFVGSAEE